MIHDLDAAISLSLEIPDILETVRKAGAGVASVTLHEIGRPRLFVNLTTNQANFENAVDAIKERYRCESPGGLKYRTHRVALWELSDGDLSVVQDLTGLR